MTRADSIELAQKLGMGLLSFPVAHFKGEMLFNEAAYREHIELLLRHKPA